MCFALSWKMAWEICIFITPSSRFKRLKNNTYSKGYFRIILMFNKICPLNTSLVVCLLVHNDKTFYLLNGLAFWISPVQFGAKFAMCILCIVASRWLVVELFWEFYKSTKQSRKPGFTLPTLISIDQNSLFTDFGNFNFLSNPERVIFT